MAINNFGVPASGPKIGAIETERVKVIPYPISTPFFTTPGVGHVPFGISPSYSQMRHHVSRLLQMVYCHLEVPFLVDCASFQPAYEYIWADTETFFIR